jgi:hypothetical protein
VETDEWTEIDTSEGSLGVFDGGHNPLEFSFLDIEYGKLTVHGYIA